MLITLEVLKSQFLTSN